MPLLRRTSSYLHHYAVGKGETTICCDFGLLSIVKNLFGDRYGMMIEDTLCL